MNYLLGAGANLVAGRSQRLPMFIAMSRLLQCLPLTMQICNRYWLQNGQTLSAILTRVFVQTASEWVPRRAGLIQLPLRYRLLVSLALLDAISCAVPRSHNLIWHCKRASSSQRERKLRLERKPTICSIARIFPSQATHKA